MFKQHEKPGKAPVKLTRAERKQIAALLARAHPQQRTPRTAQQTLSYDCMWPDGICLADHTLYTRTVQFQDVAYHLAQADEQILVIERQFRRGLISEEERYMAAKWKKEAKRREQEAPAQV